MDAVAKDREDISGKDRIDGVLWLPFNLIAKSGNYKKLQKQKATGLPALEALKNEKDCD